MSKWGTCDFKQLKQLQERIADFDKTDREKFIRAAVNEIAARLMAKVIKRTPVGQYPPSSGKVGGTLRRNWSMTQVVDRGDMYEVKVINPTEYASFVEYGHRTRGGGWCEGQFFLTKSELEIERDMPRLIEKKLMAFLKDVFND